MIRTRQIETTKKENTTLNRVGFASNILLHRSRYLYPLGAITIPVPEFVSLARSHSGVGA